MPPKKGSGNTRRASNKNDSKAVSEAKPEPVEEGELTAMTAADEAAVESGQGLVIDGDALETESPLPGADEGAVIVVGIGASAGGLEALKELLSELPQSRSLSYVIAQHLSPTHTSLLRELLRPGTDLAVCDLTDGQAPAPNTIYVTPPNHDVLLRDGVLRLSRFARIIILFAFLLPLHCVK